MPLAGFRITQQAPPLREILCLSVIYSIVFPFEPKDWGWEGLKDISA